MPVLNAAKAAIFRITHIDNVAWDLAHGLRARNSSDANPNFRNIGNLDLIEKRKTRVVPIPPGGTLSDYVPFYFTSRSPMLYNIKTGYNGIPQVPMSDIVIYATTLHHLAANGIPFVFTDRHAKLALASFFSDLKDLSRIDWAILQASDFRYDASDPEKMDRYQAEALVSKKLRSEMLAAIICYNEPQAEHVRALVSARGLQLPIHVRPMMFF